MLKLWRTDGGCDFPAVSPQVLSQMRGPALSQHRGRIVWIRLPRVQGGCQAYRDLEERPPGRCHGALLPAARRENAARRHGTQLHGGRRSIEHRDYVQAKIHVPKEMAVNMPHPPHDANEIPEPMLIIMDIVVPRVIRFFAVQLQ